MSLIFALSLAHGADVVWLSPPDERSRAAVLAAAGGQEIDALSFRSSATDITSEDEAALKALASALESVRPYEQQLDGELLIMRDLQRPIEQVTLLRDDADRNALFAALAYQGFAVDRFYGDDLAAADEAAPYRVTFEGSAVPSPWRDAVALEPDRKVGAYDIAEAPQRVRYGEVMRIVSSQLPSSLVPGPLPEGATLHIDGRVATADATGSVKLPPGRHLAHVEQGGHVIARWDLVLDPGAQEALDVPLSDDVWAAFVAGLSEGESAPEPVKAPLEARGEVWFARPAPSGPEVYAVSPSGSVNKTPVEMRKPEGSSSESSGGRPGLQLGLLGGWTGSQDFYFQDPRNEPTAALVNALTLGATAGLVVPVGPVQIGAGVDAMLPTGEGHVARTGEGSMRVRPVPHASVGLRQAALAVGYAFPYHPAVGLRGSVGIVGPLELRWLGWYGVPSSAEREGSTAYTTQPLGMAAGGVGLRL